MESNIYYWLEDVLNSEYRLIKNIRRTDTSIVNVMENIHNGKKVLVKHLTGNISVYRELLNITHKNIPIIYEVVCNNENAIVVEEFIDGLTVGEVLETGLYTAEGIQKVISEICDALYTLHKRGIVHRDIKPENIIISTDGEVKLIDFNISRIRYDNKKRDTVIMGTTGFAAPEQYGISETDARSDIFSIGILINVMLTGEHPAKKLCSGKWRRIVNKCTKINPNERYQNVEELLRVIKEK